MVFLGAAQTGLLIPTSGTTDEPKLIEISRESLQLNAHRCSDWLSVKHTDRVLCIMPIAHLHFFIRSTYPALLRGAEVVITPGFDPLRFQDWLDAADPDYFTAVPSMYRAMIRRATDTNWTPSGSRLRLLVTGSDAIDHKTIAETEALFDVPLMQFYGLSNTAPLVAVSPGSVAQKPGGLSGQVTDDWEVRCVDDQGADVEIDTVGEIVLRGGFINPIRGIDPQTRLQDGWYKTGDFGPPWHP